MRLIDADELMKQVCGFRGGCMPDECGYADEYGKYCDMAQYIDFAPTVDAVPPEVVTHNCVPIKPLCKWLSCYAAPPIIGERINIYDPGERERAWEMVLKEIDWGEEPWTE